MVLRQKKSAVVHASAAFDKDGADSIIGAPYYRPTVRYPLPHNSMFVLGLETNRVWLHGINRDKRPDSEKTLAELSLETSGARISLTFRHIGTFLSADGSLIWGQGATSKDKEHAKPVTPRSPEFRETRINLIRAFSAENQDSEFNWEEGYGAGSDVLHLEGVE